MFIRKLLGLLELLGFMGFQLVKGISSQGITIEINVDGSPTNFQTIGNVTEFNGPGGQAAVLDASNLSSVMREKLMGLPDEGQFGLGINLDPDDTVHNAVRLARRNRTLCEFRITLTDATPKKLVFFGYVLAFPIAGGVDQIVKSSITIEIDGEVNWV